MLGYNYRMSEVAAALGVEQIRRVDLFLASGPRMPPCFAPASPRWMK